MTKNETKPNKEIAIITIILVLLLIGVTFPHFKRSINTQLNTWISKDTYEKISLIENNMNSSNLPLIFVFFNQDPNVISYYENIVQMKYIDAYVYFGKLQFLSNRESTPIEYFHTENEFNLANYYFEKVEKIIKTNSSFTIAVITHDFYTIDEYSSEFLENYSISDGTFLIPIDNETELFSFGVIDAHIDAKDRSEGFFSYSEEWGYSTRILEYYDDTARQDLIYVTFPLLLSGNNQLTDIQVHLYDAALGWGNLSFYFENELIGNYSYRGTGDSVWYVMNIETDRKGVFPLNVTLDYSGNGILRFDIILVNTDLQK